MAKLYFVTGNENKLREARQILGEEVENIKLDLPEIQNIDPKKIIEEKLSEASKTGKDNLFVEDVSFHLECLNGFPGPFIKWFKDAIGIEGIYELCKKYNNFNATAVANIGFLHDGKTVFFEGAVKGKIVSPRGKSFGFDPIFVPEGHDKTYAEMAPEEKNGISHRRLALEKMKAHLNL